MWELETMGQGRHILRIGENADSINNLVKVVIVLTSVFEAIILPVLVSLVWISIYKIKQRMNASDFKLCMEATHGSTLKLFMDFFFRYERLSKSIIVFTIPLLLATILGKNIPNIMLSGTIGLHDFTTIVPSNIVLFNNDSNCIYTSCTSDLTGENFALVVNSTTIQDTMRRNYVQNTYWGLNNTLYAVRAKIDPGSCVLGIGNGSVDSSNLGNETDTLTNTGRFTGSYSDNHPSPRNVNVASFVLTTTMSVEMTDRCDIPMNLFYVSSDFSPDVVKMAKWLYDSGYVHDQIFPRDCTVYMECTINMEWKQMQVFGNTPDELEISEVRFNNTIEKLQEIVSANVLDSDINGKWFGERLISNVIDKMSLQLTAWRNIIRFQGSNHSYNLLDQFGDTLSQSLASSIQTMMNNVSVDVDKKEILTAPGLWVELTVLIFAILLTCFMLMPILTTRNPKMLLPLSILDFGIISNSIFKEYNGDGSYNQKISWPFDIVYSQDKPYRLTSANESADN
nr:10022_t:CDS:1 [Entrophospora candida]